MREGKPAEISDFRANDRLTATLITTKPPHVMTEKEVQATLAKSGAGASTPAARCLAGALDGTDRSSGAVGMDRRGPRDVPDRGASSLSRRQGRLA
jgi:hypothetical protein